MFTTCTCVSLPYSHTSGSGEDYNLTTVYTFTPDDTEIIVPITIFDDVVVEEDELLVLSLSTGLSPSIVSLNPDSANVTIRDNDGNENTCIHCSVSRESLYSGRGSRRFVLNHYSPHTEPTNRVAIRILVNFNTHTVWRDLRPRLEYTHCWIALGYDFLTHTDMLMRRL